MRRLHPVAIATSIVITIGFLTTGCGVLGTPQPEGECPTKYDAGIVWSSPTARESAIQLFTDGKVVFTLPLPVQGMTVTDQTPIRLGEDLVFISEGNVKSDRTNIIRFTPGTCSARVLRVSAPAPYNLDADAGHIYVVNNEFDVAHINVFDWEGDSIGTIDIEDHMISSLTLDSDTIYATAHLYETQEVTIRAFDIDTLDKVFTVTVPDFHDYPHSITLVDNKLYLPSAFTDIVGSTEDDRLAVIDTKTEKTEFISLSAVSPYYSQLHKKELYIAHTFMNPGLAPFSSYRHISVVDTETQEVTGHDLSDGITRFSVGITTMAVLGEDTNTNPILHTYSLSDMSQLIRVELDVPAVVQDGYAANVFAP